MGRMAIPCRPKALTAGRCRPAVLRGINPSFPGLFPCKGQVPYAVRTRAPVAGGPKSPMPLDLHVLGLPLAFILSQDQTLHRCSLNILRPNGKKSHPGPFARFYISLLRASRRRAGDFSPTLFLSSQYVNELLQNPRENPPGPSAQPPLQTSLPR